MVSFLGKLAEFLYNYLPFIVVAEDEWAVKLRWGRFCTNDILSPGLHFKLPMITEVYKCSRADQTVDVPNQNVTGWAISATLLYRVVDPRLALFRVDDYSEGIQQQVMGSLASSLSRTQDYGMVREATLEDLEIIEEQWGLEIINLEFPLFVKSPSMTVLDV